LGRVNELIAKCQQRGNDLPLDQILLAFPKSQTKHILDQATACKDSLVDMELMDELATFSRLIGNDNLYDELDDTYKRGLQRVNLTPVQVYQKLQVNGESTSVETIKKILQKGEEVAGTEDEKFVYR